MRRSGGAQSDAEMPRAGGMRSPRRLWFEALEPRQLLTVPFPLDGWQSAVFDGGVHGTLDFEFSRDVPTVSPAAEPVRANEPRFGLERLVAEEPTWSRVWDANLRDGEFLGSGWDHDGVTPLAVVFERGPGRMHFLRGEDVTVEASINYRVNGVIDLLLGSVPGYRFQPSHGIVHEGLVVFQTERSRWEDDAWVVEGITFIYTQDYGTTMHRVAQVGGGYDVPAIAGGVADGIRRAQRWSFTNAFPEKSADHLLGAWFPWADYLFKNGAPKGGQVGLFRARRPGIGQPWTVEPNVLVYERWEPEDAGGLHAHSAGMFLDGMASFWGDVGYRNHMVRHTASDLENYTTATWTHDQEFQGAWSPADQRVHRLGNQGASTAPSAVHGEFLVAGDEQPELVMKVQAPPPLRADFDGDGDVDGSDLLDYLVGFGTTARASRSDGDADGDGDVDRDDLAVWQAERGKSVSDLAPVITNLKGSFPGPKTGGNYAPRVSIWIHHLRGQGYVVHERNSRLPRTDAIHFSADGEAWTSLLAFGGVPYLYGDSILSGFGGDIYAAKVPQTAVVSPLLLNPGGTNLSGTAWDTLRPPPAGNQLRRVEFVGTQYVYADTGQPISPQPHAPPPVDTDMPMWEVTSTNKTDLGTYAAADLASSGDQLHWFTAWHYSLDGDGIAPKIQIGSNASAAPVSEWVTNHQWVPGNTASVPSSIGGQSKQSVRIFSGIYAAPRRWLMAVDSLVESTAPIYPIGPGATGSHELAVLDGFAAGEEWTVGLSFGLPQVTAFTSWADAAGLDTYRPIATIYEDAENYLQIGFATTGSGAGTFSIDAYMDGALAETLTFASTYFDVEDRAHVAISRTPSGLGATLSLPRGRYGVQSRTGIESVDIQPTKLLLSNATQTEVTPLEWFAVQVHPGVALTASEREAFVISGEFFSQLESISSAEVAALPSSISLVGVEAAPPSFLRLVSSSSKGVRPATFGFMTVDMLRPPSSDPLLLPDEPTESLPVRRAQAAASIRTDGRQSEEADRSRVFRLQPLPRAEIMDMALTGLFASPVPRGQTL